MFDLQTKDIAALIEQRSDQQQSSEETAAEAILKRAGGERTSTEEFDKHFGDLPTDGEWRVDATKGLDLSKQRLGGIESRLVEVQDFAPRHFYAQLGFAETQASVMDRRGATAKAMTDHLNLANVTMHPTAAEVRSDDERDRYRIGIMQTFAVMTGFDQFPQALGKIHGFLEMSMRHLDNPPIASTHIRTYDAAPADSFNDLRDRLVHTLTTNTTGLRDAIGISLSDIGWIFEFQSENRDVRVQFGAMTGDELRETLDDEGAGSYPPGCLFVSLDSRDRPESPNVPSPIDWWAKSVDRHRTMAERIGKWLKETVA